MRVGSYPFGMRDLQQAVASGRYRLAPHDHEAAWSALIWILSGGIKDLVDPARDIDFDHTGPGTRIYPRSMP